MYECILTGLDPLTRVIDQGVHFINDAIKYLIAHFLMKHVSSTTYYPRGNGKVKLTNKVFRTLLTKLVNENKIYWDEHLSIMLFSYRTIYKVATRYIPYQLVYGLHPLMPIEYIIPIAGGNDKGNILVKILTNIITKLKKLQETRMQATETTRIQRWNITC
jgi:hypothetical protein